MVRDAAAVEAVAEAADDGAGRRRARLRHAHEQEAVRRREGRAPRQRRGDRAVPGPGARVVVRARRRRDQERAAQHRGTPSRRLLDGELTIGLAALETGCPTAHRQKN